MIVLISSASRIPSSDTLINANSVPFILLFDWFFLFTVALPCVVSFANRASFSLTEVESLKYSASSASVLSLIS